MNNNIKTTKGHEDENKGINILFSGSTYIFKTKDFFSVGYSENL